jgi:predicted phosphodiesterase
MLAALARQMDVDVLVSGGTHRCVISEAYIAGDRIDNGEQVRGL